ncbi:hypothetical protein FACS18945_4090 [Bacteroidia bacterium]|nr:hypothetical protein FACS18945_4090 [Bacteroidia bacterium]
MGTQTEIAAQIKGKGADYVLAVKGNQGNLHEDIKLYFADAELLSKCEFTGTTEKARSSAERREYWITSDIGRLSQKNDREGIRSIGMTRNTVTKGEKVTVEERFFITSLSDNATAFAQAVRGHWTVESFHWHLDVTFGEDACRVIDKRAALNLNILRKFAISILKTVDMGKGVSMKGKRFKILLNPMAMLKSLLEM